MQQQCWPLWSKHIVLTNDDSLIPLVKLESRIIMCSHGDNENINIIWEMYWASPTPITTMLNLEAEHTRFMILSTKELRQDQVLCRVGSSISSYYISVNLYLLFIYLWRWCLKKLSWTGKMGVNKRKIVDARLACLYFDGHWKTNQK